MGKTKNERVRAAKFAPMIGKSQRSVTGYCQTGQIKAIQIGRDWLIEIAEAERINKKGLRKPDKKKVKALARAARLRAKKKAA